MEIQLLEAAQWPIQEAKEFEGLNEKDFWEKQLLFNCKGNSTEKGKSKEISDALQGMATIKIW